MKATNMTTTTPYFVYDVFTDVAFEGNQLAVFPDATGLPDDVLQKIAAEFNFSEVTFVYPPKDPKHTARVRIFTPTSEMAFAGHPIIGTVIAMSDMGYLAPTTAPQSDMILELGVGPIVCRVQNEAAGKTAAFTTSVPLDRISTPEPELVAQSIGLEISDIKTDTHIPIQASLGAPFVLVELKNRAALAACLTSINAFREGAKRYPAGLDFAVFAYVRGEGRQIISRMFAPLDNIPEDPATGSASATLAALLTEINQTPQTFSFLQGEDMGRSSYIIATTAIDETSQAISVTISGTAVRTMKGKLILQQE